MDSTWLGRQDMTCRERGWDAAFGGGGGVSWFGIAEGVGNARQCASRSCTPRNQTQTTPFEAHIGLKKTVAYTTQEEERVKGEV
eukprot:3074020-Rhodomonas_salina.1